jgi:hypothetical protein
MGEQMKYREITPVEEAKLKLLSDFADISERELHDLLRHLIDTNVSFLELGRVLDKSEATIRMFATRRGWYEAGTRRARTGGRDKAALPQRGDREGEAVS